MMADNTKENITVVPAMKLELVPVPVSDVDRAKAFYVEKAGFTLEVDTRPTDTMRVVQLTPPGSACTIVFGTGLYVATAGRIHCGARLRAFADSQRVR